MTCDRARVSQMPKVRHQTAIFFGLAYSRVTANHSFSFGKKMPIAAPVKKKRK
ncbi:hypothetical protein D3C78_1761840 [compost metagenome]